jgi:hypothetical protein
MATKSEHYQKELASRNDWDAFLMKESGLPGPRANLELIAIAAEMGDEKRIRHWLTLDPADAPVNSPQVFLAVCGLVGAGKLVAQGKTKYLKTLRAAASDSRWRVREGVVIGLQRWGDEDFDALLHEMESWSHGNLYEQRAVAAALCEPRLLRNPSQVRRVLKLLDRITASFSATKDRKSDEFVVLKKGLAYCWSVAVAASPTDGKRAMEKWLTNRDPAVQWIMRENLKKDRLRRMDAAWVKTWTARLK